MRIERATATAIPGSTPSSATARNAAIDSENSVLRCFQSRTVPGTSASETAALITTAARAGWGRFRNSPGRTTMVRTMSAAPTSPVSWLRAPARSATAVRDPLVLTGKPWKSPAARFATPMPIISWFPSTCWPVRAANADDVEMVSASDTRAMPKAPAASGARSESSAVGSVKGGNPWGSTPTSETPRAARSKTDEAAIARTTRTSTDGTLGRNRCRPSTTAMPVMPSTAAAGTALPSARPWTNPAASAINPSASTLNPNSFGSCPTMIVTARPFM